MLYIHICNVMLCYVGNNWDINKSYGSGGPMESYYTSNYGATPYGNPGSCT